MTTKGSSAREHDDAQLEEIARSLRGGFQTIEDMTRSFIREAIFRGIYRPGERLQQDNLAGFLGVSRMPVRASLRQLEAEGLVSFHPHRGATVKALTSTQIAELYELRVLLECHALQLAAHRMTARDLDDLAALAAEVEHMREGNDWTDRRQTFYRRLYELSERPETVSIIMRLRAHLGPYLLLKRVVEEPSGHRGVVDFLRAGDVDGAKRWLTEHLTRVSEQLQRMVAQEQLGDGDAPA